MVMIDDNFSDENSNDDSKAHEEFSSDSSGTEGADAPIDFDSNDSIDDADEVDITLGSGLLSIFPHITLTPWYALGEFVDNSIGSYLFNKDRLKELHGPKFKLRIDIDFVPGVAMGDSQIIISDNAAGIDKANASRAFTPGAPPLDKSGISQFGIGMKSSALWYSKYFTIESGALGETIMRTVTFDVKKILDNNLQSLPLTKKEKAVDVHGTKIVLSRLNKSLPVGATIGKIRSHLRSIYREFLKSGEIVLTVGGEELKYEAPELLRAAYWPNSNGAQAGAEEQQWIRRVEFELDESWANSPNGDKTAAPPKVRGWVGILAKGNTKSAGLALLWKKKVIVGAGNLADSDTYRPNNIFGTGNTFASQRIFGELDLSELSVTAFKDGFTWEEGQQEEMELKLQQILEESNLLSMARNYRVTEKGPEVEKQIEKTLADTLESFSEGLKNSKDVGADPFRSEVVEEELPPKEEEGADSVSRQIAVFDIPQSLAQELEFEVKDQPGDNLWLRVNYEEKSDVWRIILNRAHPFMNSFVHLPGADLNPVLRIAAALGIAEIRARNAGINQPAFIRSALNELLRAEFARPEKNGEN